MTVRGVPFAQLNGSFPAFVPIAVIETVIGVGVGIAVGIITIIAIANITVANITIANITIANITVGIANIGIVAVLLTLVGMLANVLLVTLGVLALLVGPFSTQIGLSESDAPARQLLQLLQYYFIICIFFVPSGIEAFHQLKNIDRRCHLLIWIF
jgi:hypothetical protein